MCSFHLVYVFSQNLLPGGYFQIRMSGGLGPHIRFGCKIWGKVRPSSQNKRKNLESSVTKRHKSWGKVSILGSYLKFRGQNLGYLSFIFLEAELGLQQEFQRQNLGLQQEFQRQTLEPSPPPPDLLIWKYPPGNLLQV